MRLPAAAALAALFTLTACATPAERIAAKLEEKGVPAPQARCMGERLTQRLSLSQLRTLDRAVKLNSDRIGRMSIRDIAGEIDRIGDPVLVAEVLRAGIGCSI